MEKLSTHLLRVAEDGIGDEAGHIGWHLALQTEDPCEVVCIDDKEN